MKNKTLISSIVVILVLIVVGFGIYFKLTPKQPYEIKFTEDKLITNQTLIDLIVNKQLSPLGNNLTKHIEDLDDPEIMDDGWRISYYVCNKDEHLGWIYYSAGESSIKSGLYGPYGWCLI